jgi:hypothetical protein
MNAWRWLISVLVSMSSHPDAIHDEAPKAAAAVAVAYANLPRRESAPELKPEAEPQRPHAKHSCRCGGFCSRACTCGCHSVLPPSDPCMSGKCRP